MSSRLSRLLLVVPAASGPEGVALDELARELDCSPAELQKDLDILACVGVPPFNPDDLIELELRDGRVYVTLPQSFDRPTRLSATEAAALTLAGRALAPDAPRVQSALEKLKKAIAPAQLPLYELLIERLGAAPPATADEVSALLDEACVRRREVEIHYFAGTERRARTRRVRPRAIVSANGVAYLSARNESDEERTYRIDRISRAVLLDTSFDALPEIDLAAKLEALKRFSEHSDLPRATVRFAPEVSGAVKARHPDAQPTEAGGLEVQLPWASMPWLVSYVLSWGGRAVVVHPPEARSAVRDAVEALRAAH